MSIVLKNCKRGDTCTLANVSITVAGYSNISAILYHYDVLLYHEGVPRRGTTYPKVFVIQFIKGLLVFVNQFIK